MPALAPCCPQLSELFQHNPLASLKLHLGSFSCECSLSSVVSCAAKRHPQCTITMDHGHRTRVLPGKSAQAERNCDPSWRLGQAEGYGRLLQSNLLHSIRLFVLPHPRTNGILQHLPHVLLESGRGVGCCLRRRRLPCDAEYILMSGTPTAAPSHVPAHLHHHHRHNSRITIRTNHQYYGGTEGWTRSWPRLMPAADDLCAGEQMAPCGKIWPPR
jgi:hypothetical protein